MKPSHAFAVSAMVAATLSTSPWENNYPVFTIMAGLLILLMWASMWNERNDSRNIVRDAASKAIGVRDEKRDYDESREPGTESAP